MSRWTAWKAIVIVAAFVAWPVVATAQSNPPQQPPTQPPSTQQPPQAQQPPSTQSPQSQSGSPQSQGTEAQRQEALAHLTAARQDLADITKLPAAAHIEGEPRNDLNQLITNFNALITSSGPEWREAYDKVQGNLNSLLGPDPQAGGEATSGQSAVGTSGALPSLDPTIVAKLTDVRQHIDQFGNTVGVKPGQSAVAQQQNQAGGTAATAGRTPDTQALRTNIEQIDSIVSRLLSQGAPDQQTLTVNRQALQQIQQYLNQLRLSLGQDK